MPYGNGTNAPLGLRPSQYINGATWNGQTSQYNLASGYGTSIGTGDPVYINNAGKVIIGAAGANPLLGVFWGVQYTDTFGNPVFSPVWNANTVTSGAADATAFVIDDPNVLFDIQGVGNAPSGGVNTINQADILNNGTFVIAAPNAVSGQSNSYFSNAAILTTIGLNLKIVRFTPIPGNIAGSTFNNVLVSINNHIFKSTGTLGV